VIDMDYATAAEILKRARDGKPVTAPELAAADQFFRVMVIGDADRRRAAEKTPAISNTPT